MKGHRKHKSIRYRVMNNNGWFYGVDGSYSNVCYTEDWDYALQQLIIAGPGSDISWKTKRVLRLSKENVWTYEKEMEYRREKDA